MKYIYIFIGIIILKFLYNLLQYLNNFRLNKIWKSFFLEKPNINAITYAKSIQQHIVNAGIEDSKQPISIQTAPGIFANTHYSFLNNIFTNNKDVYIWFDTAFLAARGVYRTRMLESFNPFYWIKLIVFLPKNIIKYLGLDTNSIFTKLSQIIFWIVDSILIVTYQEEVSAFIRDLISRLFDFFTQ